MEKKPYKKTIQEIIKNYLSDKECDSIAKNIAENLNDTRKIFIALITVNTELYNHRDEIIKNYDYDELQFRSLLDILSRMAIVNLELISGKEINFEDIFEEEIKEINNFSLLKVITKEEKNKVVMLKMFEKDKEKVNKLDEIFTKTGRKLTFEKLFIFAKWLKNKKNITVSNTEISNKEYIDLCEEFSHDVDKLKCTEFIKKFLDESEYEIFTEH